MTLDVVVGVTVVKHSTAADTISADTTSTSLFGLAPV